VGKLLLLLAVVAVVAEVATPRVLERDVEQRVDEVVRAADVAAVVGGFPFLPPLLDEGRVASLDVTLSDVDADPLTLTEVRFDFDELVVSRRSLLRGEVVVQDLGAGRVDAEIRTEDLAAAAGLPAGAIPDELSGSVTVDRRALELAGRALSLPEGVVPCDPELELDGEVVRLGCGFDEVPEVLRRAVATEPAA
jgi:hypothetical protein